MKVKVEPGFDDSAPRLPTLELLDDPESEATLEPPVKKVKKEKLENPEKNDNLDDLLGMSMSPKLKNQDQYSRELKMKSQGIQT